MTMRKLSCKLYYERRTECSVAKTSFITLDIDRQKLTPRRRNRSNPLKTQAKQNALQVPIMSNEMKRKKTTHTHKRNDNNNNYNNNNNNKNPRDGLSRFAMRVFFTLIICYLLNNEYLSFFSYCFVFFVMFLVLVFRSTAVRRRAVTNYW